MNFPKTICFILFLLIFHFVFAQSDSLVLFTKKGCSNCAYAKKQFTENHIAYTERPVEDKTNSSLMLSKLKETGYKGSIFMPVIFVNNTIMHPAVKKDTALIGISLAHAVDSIINKYKNGELHFPGYAGIQPTHAVYDSADIKDCEMKLAPVYVICANFILLSDAERFAKVLANEGYSNANVLNFKKFYRVYSEILYDNESAETELKKVREKYRGAYLLSLE